MTPAQMALLHAESFTLPPPWSQAEIEATLASPFTFVLTRPQAFLLGQVVAGEATLLTIAVAPTARRTTHVCTRHLQHQLTTAARVCGAAAGLV